MLRTKWWPNQLFTFLLLVAEVNCVQARVHPRKEVAKPMLIFRKNLAMRMLLNNLGPNWLAAGSPSCRWRHTSTVHMLKKRAMREGKWNYSTHAFNKINLDYVRYPCSNCKKPIRTYCPCDPGALRLRKSCETMVGASTECSTTLRDQRFLQQESFAPQEASRGLC